MANHYNEFNKKAQNHMNTTPKEIKKTNDDNKKIRKHFYNSHPTQAAY